jgi:hypothetical protein
LTIKKEEWEWMKEMGQRPGVGTVEGVGRMRVRVGVGVGRKNGESSKNSP